MIFPSPQFLWLWCPCPLKMNILNHNIIAGLIRMNILKDECQVLFLKSWQASIKIS
jgi:hypothetical protein